MTWALAAVGPLIILVASWLMPSLAQPTLPFGVRVPPDRVHEPVIAEQRRHYRWFVSIAGIAVIGLGLLVMVFVGVGRPVLGVLIPLLVLAVCVPGYLRARSAILAVKSQERWYAGLREGVAVDTSLRTQPVTFPWTWAAPAVAILLGNIALAIVRYPHLPPRLIVHINASGTPDRTVATSVLTVAAPILLQFGITAALLLSVWLSLRSRGDLDPSAPHFSAHRYRLFSARMARSMLILAACVNLSLLGLCWQVWSGGTDISVWPIAAPILLGVIALFGMVLFTGQAGGRIPADRGDPDRLGSEASTGLVHRDDDRFWRGGLIYVNRADPTLFVPKRYGIGWTLNFGNPRSTWVMAGILLLIAVGPVLGALAGH